MEQGEGRNRAGEDRDGEEERREEVERRKRRQPVQRFTISQVYWRPFICNLILIRTV